MLALDIDDILADTTRTRFFTLTHIFWDCGMTFEEAMKNHGGRNNTIWTSPEAQQWMKEKNHDNEYQKSLSLVDDALESVQLLHNHYQPFSYYITARPETVLSWTKEWLEYHDFPRLPIIIRPTSIRREQEHTRKVWLLHQLYKEWVSGIIDDQMKLLHHMENLHPDYSWSLHIIWKENNLSTQLNHTISYSRTHFIQQFTDYLSEDILLHNNTIIWSNE